MDILMLNTEIARIEGEIRFAKMKIERGLRINSPRKIIARYENELAAWEAELARVKACA